MGCFTLVEDGEEVPVSGGNEGDSSGVEELAFDCLLIDDEKVEVNTVVDD